MCLPAYTVVIQVKCKSKSEGERDVDKQMFDFINAMIDDSSSNTICAYYATKGFAAPAKSFWTPDGSRPRVGEVDKIFTKRFLDGKTGAMLVEAKKALKQFLAKRRSAGKYCKLLQQVRFISDDCNPSEAYANVSVL